jgi:hypothetical protein
MFHELKLDWTNGRVGVEKTTFPQGSEPRRAVPHRQRASKERYLTGSDFDIESIQPVGGTYWLGDEFGPWLINVAADGTVLKVVATKVGDVDYKSPDNQTVVTPQPGHTARRRQYPAFRWLRGHGPVR